MTQRHASSVLAVLCLLAACASPAPERFYRLGPQAPASTHPFQGQVSLSVVSIPEIVDRSEMVFGAASGEVHISQALRWAEPLRVGVERVLAEDVEARLPGARVAPAAGSDADFRVAVTLQSFDAAPQTGVHVVADVAIVATTGGAVAPPLRVHADVPVTGARVGDILGAENEALGEVSDAIAAALARR